MYIQFLIKNKVYFEDTNRLICSIELVFIKIPLNLFDETKLWLWEDEQTFHQENIAQRHKGIEMDSVFEQQLVVCYGWKQVWLKKWKTGIEWDG